MDSKSIASLIFLPIIASQISGDGWRSSKFLSDPDLQFTVVNGMFNWYQAVYLCRNVSNGRGRLVVLETQDERDFFLSEMKISYSAPGFPVNANKGLYGDGPTWASGKADELPDRDEELSCYALYVNGSVLDVKCRERIGPAVCTQNKSSMLQVPLVPLLSSNEQRAMLEKQNARWVTPEWPESSSCSYIRIYGPDEVNWFQSVRLCGALGTNLFIVKTTREYKWIWKNFVDFRGATLFVDGHMYIYGWGMQGRFMDHFYSNSSLFQLGNLDYLITNDFECLTMYKHPHGHITDNPCNHKKYFAICMRCGNSYSTTPAPEVSESSTSESSVLPLTSESESTCPTTAHSPLRTTAASIPSPPAFLSILIVAFLTTLSR